MAAANTDLVRKGTNNFSTTLSGSIGSGDTTISLASTTNLPTDTAIDLVIDRVDASGNKTASLREYIVGVVSGTNIITALRGKGGSSAQSHSSGAVVEYVFTQDNLNDRSTAFLQDHAQLGYHKSLTDVNNKTWLAQTATASAVNYLTLANAATGNAPILSATGSDSNIGLHIAGKGTNSPHWYGFYDGWYNPNESWTYSSYDSTNKTGVITIPSGGASRYNVKDRVKFTNNSAIQYGIVTKVADTALTVYFGTDYSLTNSAITLNYASHESSPVGFSTDPAKWMASATYSSDATQTATGGTWYNLGSLSISAPIGIWFPSFGGYWDANRASASSQSLFVALSSSNSSVSDAKLEIAFAIGGATGTQVTGGGATCNPNETINVSSATTYYLIEQAVATTGTNGLRLLGATYFPAYIQLRSALL